MARKTATITIGTEGRDKGKQFLLTEMPASQSEEWAIRLLALLAKARAEIPAGFQAQGLQGLATLGFRALGEVSFDEARPLFAVMMDCVEFIPDASHPNVKRRLIEDDIEEVATRLQLRMEVFKLHTDFLQGVASSI